MSTIETLFNSIMEAPWAWPGGYERFAITDDGGLLCWQCVQKEREIILDSCPGDGWHIVAIGSEAETDAECWCDNCQRIIVEGFEND